MRCKEPIISAQSHGDLVSVAADEAWPGSPWPGRSVGKC